MRKSRFSVEQIDYALKRVETDVPVGESWVATSSVAALEKS